MGCWLFKAAQYPSMRNTQGGCRIVSSHVIGMGKAESARLAVHSMLHGVCQSIRPVAGQD